MQVEEKIDIIVPHNCNNETNNIVKNNAYFKRAPKVNTTITSRSNVGLLIVLLQWRSKVLTAGPKGRLKAVYHVEFQMLSFIVENSSTIKDH